MLGNEDIIPYRVQFGPLEAQRHQDLRRDVSLVDQNPVMIVLPEIEEWTAPSGTLIEHCPWNSSLSPIRTCYSSSAQLPSVVTEACGISRHHTSHITKAGKFSTAIAGMIGTTTVAVLIARGTCLPFGTGVTVKAEGRVSKCRMFHLRTGRYQLRAVHL